MFQRTKSELLPLTPSLANEFAQMEKLPGERPLKVARLRFFEDHVTAGTFRDPHWSIGIHRESSKRYRLDGQHTSAVLVNLPPERFPKNLHVEISTWEFDSMEHDRPALFDMFDHPKSARSNEDVMGVWTCTFEELRTLGNRFCVQVASGIAEFESSQKEGQVLPARSRGIYFLRKPDYRAFALWLQEFLRDAALVNRWMFGKPGIVAEMLSDWKSNVAMSTEFWGYVLCENHPERDHVTRELAEDLKKWNQKMEQRPAKDYRNRVQKAWRRYQKEIEFAKHAELPARAA